MKPVIGLIGGIGSGKSRVAEAFAWRGGRVIDADRIGHAALRDPEIRRQIVEHWGAGLLDESGEIVRRRLGRIVFADDADRRALEAIVHPWIGRRVREEVAAAQADADSRFVLLDAAVMLEAGWNGVCDKLVFVDTPRSVRLERLARQRGWSENEVEARERAQLPLTEKAARADHVLENSGTMEDLERQVDDLLRAWVMTPSGEPPRQRGEGVTQCPAPPADAGGSPRLKGLSCRRRNPDRTPAELMSVSRFGRTRNSRYILLPRHVSIPRRPAPACDEGEV